MNDNPIKVIIDRNSIRITPFVMNRYDKNKGTYVGTSFTLEKEFQEYIFVRRRYAHFLPIYDKLSKSFMIPRGFGVDKVLYTLDNGHVNYEVIDNALSYPEYDTVDIALKDITMNYARDKDQVEALEFLNDNQNNLRYIKLDTGIGKTYVAINYMCSSKIKSIVISDLNEQWSRELVSRCNISLDEMYFIKGRESIITLLKKSDSEIAKYKIIFGSFKTLNNYYEAEYNGKNNPLQDLFNFLRIGMKVYDEAHINFSAIYKLECRTNTYQTLFLSATSQRSKSSENQVYQKIFRFVSSFGEHTFLQSKHYDIIYANFHSILSDYQIHKCFYKQYDRIDINTYTNYLFENDDNVRNLFMIFVQFFHNVYNNDKDAKFLFILSTIEAINKLKYFFETFTVLSVGNYTSELKDDAKKAMLSKTIIISTYKSAGTGMDVRNLRMIFNLQPMSSVVPIRQTLGRLRKILNKNTYYVDFIDKTCVKLIDMSLKRRNILKAGAKTETVYNFETPMNLREEFNRFLKDPKYKNILN